MRPKRIGGTPKVMLRPSLRLALPAFLLAAYGCSCDPDEGIGDISPLLQIEETSVDFGKVVVGDLRVRRLRLTNAGRSTLNLTTFELSSSSTEFSFGEERPSSIQAGASVDVGLVYLPTDLGEDTGTITLEGNDEKGPHTVTLRGEGVENGIEVSHDGEPCGTTPGSLSFGRVTPGDTATRNITLRALGQASLTIFTAEREPGTSVEFEIDPVERGRVLNPGESLTLAARYRPADGVPDTGAFVITTDAADGGSTRIAICGESVAPAICASPVPLDLGPVAQGSTARRRLEIKSCGTEPLVIDVVQLSADASNPTDPGFGIENVPSLPRTMAPGETFEIDVTYAATQLVSATGFVKAVSNALNLRDAYFPIGARGAQPCGLSVLPSRLLFRRGGQTEQRLLIANDGASECAVNRLEVTAGATNFALVSPPSTPFAINPGGQIEVAVAYTAGTGAGPDTGTLEVEGGSSILTVDLVGEALPTDACTVDIVPAFVNFGAVEPGSIGSRGVNVNNIGSDPCFVRGVRMKAGSDPAFQSTSSNFGIILDGRSKTLSVAFRPTAFGPVQGTLEIQLSDSLVGGNSITVDVPLFGTGMDQGICVEPRHLPFGSGVVGAQTLDFRIYACGSRDVTITALDWTTMNADFTMPTPPATPFTLASGSDRVVTVRYAPNAAPLGDFAALTVRSNDPVEPAIEVEMTGGQQVVPYEAGRYLYYWQIVGGVAGDVMQLPLQGNVTTRSFWGPRSGKQCTGCHVLSPDGKYVALIEFISGPNFKVVDTQTNMVIQSLPTEVSGATYFSWRPNVATTPPYQFVFDDAGGDLKIATLFDGFIGPVNGANDPNYLEVQPSWGPNGKIVYVRGTQGVQGQGGQGNLGLQGPTDLMIVDEGGGTPTVLMGAGANTFANYYPAFSPNGDWIAFTQSRAAQSSIAASDATLLLARSDNSGVLRTLPLLNSASGASSFPTWSVNGAFLSFSSNRPGGAGDWDIYIAPVDPVTGMDGASVNVVEANSSSFEHSAQWSP